MQLPWMKKPVTIGVIGDLILDEYLVGQVNRISPEAPVPVHLVKDKVIRAGGAANSALNICKLGARVHLFGVCGQDEAGRELLSLLTRESVHVDGVIEDPDGVTIKKSRLTANHQQLVRIDWEKVTPLSKKLEQSILEHLQQSSLDGILLSDYGKGGLTHSFLQEVFRWAQSSGIPVVVDPKGVDYTRYQGAQLITPNRYEACFALGFDPAEEFDYRMLACELQKQFQLQDVLITLGPEGMYYLPKGAEQGYFCPAEAKQVYDVSGAGDTVAATMILALVCSLNPQEATALASTAASIAVGKWGTVPVYANELLNELLVRQHGPRLTTTQKIVSWDELRSVIQPPGLRHQKIIFTNGCFDILHAGHVSYLEKAKALGDILVVAVNSDRSVRELKGPQRPINCLEDRLKVLAALACTDYVVAFDEPDPQRLIDILVPDVLVKGADWSINDIKGKDTVLNHGGRVVTIELVEGLSTTKIIDKIKSH